MDRRLKTRVEWNGPVKYEVEGTGIQKTGVLSDISTTGALIWLKDELDMEAKIEVVMQSQFDPKPVHMHMVVKRREPAEREGYIGYGCILV